MSSPELSRRRRGLRTTLKFSILAIYILGNLLNLQAGWADNGDYYRIMTWFTSGPVNQVIDWPTYGTKEYDERFFTYWIPYWKLDFPKESEMFISAVLLWTPGVLLNRFFYSAQTLYMPLLSLGPRLALFIFLWLCMKWIDRRAKIPEIHYLTLGLPLALLFSTTDIAAYFNTFYQETGTIVFIPYVLGIIVLGQSVARDWRFYLVYFAAIFLAATSKSSLVYLPLVTVFGVISLQQVRRKPFTYLVLGAGLVLIPMAASLYLTEFKTPTPNRAYNSLINGTLLYSRDVDSQLATLGLTEARDCIGVDLYSEAGAACMKQLAPRMSYLTTLKSILNEPGILLRQVRSAVDTMQKYTNELGLYAKNDPAERRSTRLNLWSEMKSRIFPRGWWLVVASILAAALLALAWRRKEPSGDLASDLVAVGVICLVCMWADILVQMLGDGPRDLLKHLLTANLFFDFLLIVVVNVGVVLISQALARFGIYQPGEALPVER